MKKNSRVRSDRPEKYFSGLRSQGGKGNPFAVHPSVRIRREYKEQKLVPTSHSYNLVFFAQS